MDLEALSADIHLLGICSARRSAGSRARRRTASRRRSARRRRGCGPTPRWRRRGGSATASAGSSWPSLRTLIRAFSIYFDLINLAEQQARVRALRERTADRAADRAGAPMAETPEAALRQLRERGIDAAEVAEHLERALVCLVFTAHPSEARRRTILEKLNAIAHQLDRIEYTRPAAGRARRGRRRDRRGGRDHLALGDDPGLSPDRAGRGPAGAGAGRGPAARRRPADLPQAGGRAGAGLSRAPVARPLVPPVRVLDRRRPGRPPERHAPGHGRGGPAPAGDDPRATTWSGSTTSGGGSATPTAASKPGPAFRESLARDAALFPEVDLAAPSTSPIGPSVG